MFYATINFFNGTTLGSNTANDFYKINITLSVIYPSSDASANVSHMFYGSQMMYAVNNTGAYANSTPDEYWWYQYEAEGE